jgi:hypothetical protein
MSAFDPKRTSMMSSPRAKQDQLVVNFIQTALVTWLTTFLIESNRRARGQSFFTYGDTSQALCNQPTSGNSSLPSLTRVHSLKALSTLFANLFLCSTKNCV